MCEQACPVEAIELTSFYDLTGSSREEMIFDKEKLLSVFDQTKDREPMPSKRGAGSTEHGANLPAPCSVRKEAAHD
jgi:NADH-quinone oxidoreductase subunit I